MISEIKNSYPSKELKDGLLVATEYNKNVPINFTPQFFYLCFKDFSLNDRFSLSLVCKKWLKLNKYPVYNRVIDSSIKKAKNEDENSVCFSQELDFAKIIFALSTTINDLRDTKLDSQVNVFINAFNSFQDMISKLSVPNFTALTTDVALVMHEETINTSRSYLKEINLSKLDFNKIPPLFYHENGDLVLKKIHIDQVISTLKNLICFNQIELSLNIANLIRNYKKNEIHMFVLNYLKATSKTRSAEGNFNQLLNFLKTAEEMEKLDDAAFGLADLFTAFCVKEIRFIWFSISLCNYYLKNKGSLSKMKLLVMTIELKETIAKEKALTYLTPDTDHRNQYINRLEELEKYIPEVNSMF
jgi:hypothetical protein